MIVLTISFIIVVIDQISKYLIRSSMELHETIPIIKNFFHLTYVSNDGMAFGINFPGGIYLFTIASFILTIILIVYLWHERKSNIILRISLALIIAGAIGNFIDRAMYKEVVDMFDFIFWGYHWYIFNVADSAVTVGMIIYLIYSFFLQPKKQTVKTAI
ncbi:MAG: signal peptidase II [Candidatus Marinimicrobia bacterium]|nr:signal peptidase II [Candidatus Neomarinimicrobiota bacterium]